MAGGNLSTMEVNLTWHVFVPKPNRATHCEQRRDIHFCVSASCVVQMPSCFSLQTTCWVCFKSVLQEISFGNHSLLQVQFLHRMWLPSLELWGDLFLTQESATWGLGDPYPVASGAMALFWRRNWLVGSPRSFLSDPGVGGTVADSKCTRHPDSIVQGLLKQCP